MRTNFIISVPISIFILFSSCVLDKTTHKLYKGKFSDGEKVVIKVSKMSGVNYTHIYYLAKAGKMEYWVYFKLLPIDPNGINYRLERHDYAGKKYLSTSYASDKECSDTSLFQPRCIKLLPNEYSLLKFVSNNLKEYNYENIFSEASIDRLKYWMRDP